jgi:hypothetical protein
MALAFAAGCGGAGEAAPADTVDAAPAIDGAPAEDLDLQLADFKDIPGFATPPGRSYRVANPLGHEAEALAAAAAPAGGTFPVGSIVEIQPTEVMVKRRRGFDATTNDWEYFGITFATDGVTPVAFSVRGVEETACYGCHSTMSSATWDFMCEHP